METNSDADEPMPPATPEPPPAPATDIEAAASPEPPPEATAPATDAPAAGGPEAPDAADELSQLADASARARLSPAQEERLTLALKEALLGGRAGVARAIDALTKVPWIVGVRSVEQAWPELTAGFRTQLLSGLAKDETDAARRMRLSLARALFKIEVPLALKTALGVLKDMRDKETGALSLRSAQTVSNVFVGRGKPWLAQLPLAELKPAEIDLLVHSAVFTVFSIPHPPVTQLGVLKWTQEAGRLDKVQEPALAAVLSGVARWSAKWQNALRKEVADLPEAILAVLKPEPAAGEAEAPATADDERAEDDETGDEAEERAEGEAPAAPKKERPVYEPRPQRSPEAAAAEPREPREPQKERPVYTPRNAGTSGSEPRESRESRGRGFNVNEALKGIDAHIRSLQAELSQAQAKLRQKEDRPRRAEKAVGPIIEGEPTPEELARLNLQLAARNEELQTRIDELAQHSEDMAASVGAMSGEPVNDTAAQLRTLLGFKLQEDFADFLALEQEGDDLVVQQHYRTIARHVFEILREVQIPLAAPAEERTP